MDAERLAQELTCPITRELLSDPVTLPCCAKPVGRAALRSALAANPACPLCRSPLPGGPGAADAATPNRVAQALLDALASGPAAESRLGGRDEPPAEERPSLSATFCPLPVPPSATGGGDVRRIARLQLRVTNAAAVGLRRVLCVLVVDRSGSMAGSPWRQASSALKHIVAMAGEAHLSHVTLRIVTYNSSSFALDCSGGADAICGRIDAIRPGMGTSFRSAFGGTMKVVREEIVAAEAATAAGAAQDGSVGPMPRQVCVVFMTDGQAHEARAGLAEEFQGQILKFRAGRAAGPMVAAPEFTVHSVGFSSGCDKVLLEQIRKSGTHPGQFRYCEPGDSEDALCGRLTGMFEQIAAHGGCNVTIERILPSGNISAGGGATIPPSWEFLGKDGEALPSDGSGKVTVDLRVKSDGVGTAVSWISFNAQEGDPANDRQEFVLPIAVTCNAASNDAVEGRIVGPVSMLEDTPQDHESASPVAALTHSPDWTVVAKEDCAFSTVGAVKRAWVGVRIHAVAEDAISLAEAAAARERPLAPEAVRLWGAFLEHRLRALSTVGSDAHDRVPLLLEQLMALSNWGTPGYEGAAVSVGRLRDISSASAFSSSRAPVPSSSSAPLVASARSSAGWKAKVPPAASPYGRSTHHRTRERGVMYPGNPDDMDRNELQNLVMGWGQRRGADLVVDDLLRRMESTDQAALVNHADRSGNTALHLAAYHGQFDALLRLFEADPSCGVDAPNHYGETPVTIAIKRRGYHKSVEVLRSLGGSVPEDRAEDLIAFCNAHRYPRTAHYLRQLVSAGTLGPSTEAASTSPSRRLALGLTAAADLPPLVFEESMPHIVVRSHFQAAMANGRPVDWKSLVRMALQYTDAELLGHGLAHIEAADLDVGWVFADCFPPKADAPDTPKFLMLLEKVLAFAPEVLQATLTEARDTLLHRAVTAGSLPHCQLLVERGLSPELPNASGDTPLHSACLKRYPCIVDFFIAAGADVNAKNLKGITPVAVAVHMGSLRIVETLIAAGAAVDGPAAVACDSSNLLHIAVRNNRSEILALLLDRADPETILEADTMGFTPILAAVEGDRKECLQLLLDVAADVARTEGNERFAGVLERRTPASSALPSATALHVAVYHGRRHAVAALLARGADPSALDGRGLAPLHIAARAGDAPTIRALLAHGASPTVRDGAGRTPESYGGGRPDVMAALVGPVPGPLRAFAAGDMSAYAVAACAEVVGRAPEVVTEPGLFDASKILDMALDNLGQTALIIAVSHGNAAAVEGLVRGGAALAAEDNRGLSAAAWAQMAKSRRLLGALGVPAEPPLPAAKRYAEAVKRWGGAEASAIFLGQRRDESRPPSSSTTTSLHRRLTQLARAFGRVQHTPNDDGGKHIPSVSLLRSAPRKGMVDRVSLSPARSLEQRALEADRWASKICAAGLVASASGKNGAMPIRPSHAFATLLATLHGPIVPALNVFLEQAPKEAAAVPMKDRSILEFAASLSDALDGLTQELDAQDGDGDTAELYALAPLDLPCTALSVGSEVSLVGFASAVADWTVALSSKDAFDGATERDNALPAGGVLALIVSVNQPTARELGSLSSFPQDGEVMFRPGTRFRVMRWYRGDIQVLGRPREERDTMFDLGPEDIVQAEEGKIPVIVHVGEIC